MMAIPSIDMEATGRNITRLRQQAGLTAVSYTHLTLPTKLEV